jgi:la-related protein 1
MSATVTGPVEAAPAAPTFSYAQAAKGRTAPAASAIQSSQATSGVSTPAKDSVSSAYTPSASVNGGAGSDAGDHHLNGNHVVEKADPIGVGMNMEAKPKLVANSGSVPSSPSLGTASTSTLAKEEEVKLPANSSSEGSWRNHHSAPGTDAAAEATEGRKGKKGKKQKNTEKEPEKEKEEVKPEVLVAAPPPAVNIWQQRKEAQAAKAKSSPSIPQSLQIPDTSSTNDSTAQSSKSIETKRQSTAGDEGEKPQASAQNGGQKDISASARSQKRGSDGTNKAKDDATKRAGPRGSRGLDKDDKAQPNQLPPPVEDALSWPTPEIALEEEKRKAQEKPEKELKDETTSNKSRPKEKWMPVPFVPSVNFSTPIPPRGGRGRGGARGGRDSNSRGGHTSTGGVNPEKTNQSSTATASATGDNETRGRGNSNGARAASLPPNSSKRPSSDPQERKSTATTSVGKSKTQLSSTTKGETVSMTTPQTDLLGGSYQVQQASRGDFSKKADQKPSSNEGNSKYNMADRRGDPSLGSDQFTEPGVSGKENGPARERTEVRSDRGRGSLRGNRGGHNTFSNTQNSQQTFANGHATQPTNGFPPRQNSIPYSSPIPQGHFTNQFVQASSRGGRGSSRSQSIPNTAIFPRFPVQPSQTNQSMYDYQALQQPMSATPYNPFSMEHYSVLAMLTMQLEYYFSIDNLCKDVFLRKHMDSQGFVFLHFIANFKRVQALTTDPELLRHACHESRIIDIIQGEDGLDRLRRQEGWEKWVLAMEDRDETVRNAGPKYHHRLPSRTQHIGQMMLSGNQPMSPPPFSPNGTESSFQNYANHGPTMNGNSLHPEIPLSAAVADFSPGVSGLKSFSSSLADSFSDEEVEALMIVVTSSKSHTPFRSTTSRTFSNGSIDRYPIADEENDSLRQGRTLANGSRASEK